MENRIIELKEESLTTVCEKIDEDLINWNGEKPFDDDVSLLAIEFTGVKPSTTK